MTDLQHDDKDAIDAIDAVRKLEDARYAATIGKDVATLDGLFDDKLSYSHSSGVSDTKASYIAGIEGGKWDYRNVERTETRYTAVRNVVLVSGMLAIDLVSDGKRSNFKTHALAVWIRQPAGWRLLAVHSAAVSPSHGG